MARLVRVPVFQFLAYDRETGRYAIAPRYATWEAIRAAEGILLARTGVRVTVFDLDPQGYVSVLRSVSLRAALLHGRKPDRRDRDAHTS
ncbi:MAG TPA: hypothetical protein VH040_03135 [Usitatibacter sp.]|jgi:hypothetical protein|nr:hypothetical protein [Usitatibacter sp.]